MICGKQNLEAFGKKIGFTKPEKNQEIIQIIDSIREPYAPSEVVPNLAPLLKKFKGFSKNPAVHDAIIKGSASKYALRLLLQQTKGQQIQVPEEIEKHAFSDLLWLTIISARKVPNPDQFVY